MVAAAQSLTSPGRVLIGGCYAIVCPEDTLCSKNLGYRHECTLDETTSHDTKDRHSFPTEKHTIEAVGLGLFKICPT